MLPVPALFFLLKRNTTIHPLTLLMFMPERAYFFHLSFIDIHLLLGYSVYAVGMKLYTSYCRLYISRLGGSPGRTEQPGNGPERG